jgi:aryl-alcohol dehydrogenase-like predicted oxidoreductase
MRYLSAGTATPVSRIGLGTWQFGSREWGYGRDYAGQEAHAIVRRALELGVTLFDTAEIYGFGRSERILGAALGERLAQDRESVFLATKILPVLPAAPVVEQRAVASANRLGARRLDLYQVHQPNPLVRDGSLMRGMRALQRVGLVAEVGVSNYSLDRWRAAEQALGSRVLSNQVRYNLVDRTAERDLLPFAASTGHVVIAYSPLAQGLLSGRYDRDSRPGNSLRAASPLFLPENLDRAGDLIAALREVADAHSATPAQIALAWAIRRPGVVAIPGASSVGQLESNVAAADLDLTEDEYQALCAAADRFRPVTGPAALPRLARARFRRRLWCPGDRHRRHRRTHPDPLRHHHRGRGEPGPVQGGAHGARLHAATRLADHPGQPARRPAPRRAGLPDPGRRPRAGRPALRRGPLPGHRAAPPQPGRPRPRLGGQASAEWIAASR